MFILYSRCPSAAPRMSLREAAAGPALTSLPAEAGAGGTRPGRRDVGQRCLCAGPEGEGEARPRGSAEPESSWGFRRLCEGCGGRVPLPGTASRPAPH